MKGFILEKSLTPAFRYVLLYNIEYWSLHSVCVVNFQNYFICIFFLPQHKLIFIILELTVFFFSFCSSRIWVCLVGFTRPTSASTRNDLLETEMLRVAMEKSWNQMKTNWWILDIWNRCVTVGRPPVLEANAAAYGGFDYVVREHRGAASCKAVQPLFCWEE